MPHAFAAGDYGERIENPAAIERALEAMRDEGRQVLLNVHIRYPEQLTL